MSKIKLNASSVLREDLSEQRSHRRCAGLQIHPAAIGGHYEMSKFEEEVRSDYNHGIMAREEHTNMAITHVNKDTMTVVSICQSDL
jgi:hypothetical protein